MIKDLHRRGISISEIARLTGRDRKTIRQVIQEPVTPVRTPRRAKVGKLENYRPYLEQRMTEGVFNAQKLYQEIKEQGYPGKERLVRAFVQPFRQASQSQATVRFETQPGEQAQVDWGHFGLIQHQGRQQRLYGFVMTLGWSRTMYLEFTVSLEAAWFLRCHVHAFHYFGGIPREMLHDNLKTAVLSRDMDGTIHWHPRYLDFADYYGFRPRACQPYRAQTKGKVESGVKYVRRNFWLGLRFVDLADLNQQALTWLNTVANVRRHGTTGEVPLARLPLEQLTPLTGKADYDTSLLSYRRSSRDCLVSYAGNYYSVPAGYALQRLHLKETEAGELLIFNLQGDEVARHHLINGRNQRLIVPSHYHGITPSTTHRRPAGATQVTTRPDQLLAPTWTAPEVEIRPLSVYEQVLEVAA